MGDVLAASWIFFLPSKILFTGFAVVHGEWRREKRQSFEHNNNNDSFMAYLKLEVAAVVT